MGDFRMFAQTSRAALALLVLTVAAAPAVAEEAMTPMGFWGFDAPAAATATASPTAGARWSAESVDFSGVSDGTSQISTFGLSAGAEQAAPGFETTAHGEIDWAHRDAVGATASRLRAREGAMRGVGLVSFDGSSHRGGLGWGLNR